MSLAEEKPFPREPDGQPGMSSEASNSTPPSNPETTGMRDADSHGQLTSASIGTELLDASRFPMQAVLTSNGAIQSQADARYSPDLQISWGWPHLILFVLYGVISLVLVQTALMIHYAPRERVTRKQLEQILLAKPQFALGSMVIWYALLFFFLYITLAVLRGHSFWNCLGWRKIPPKNSGKSRHALFFLLCGCGLSLMVALFTSKVRPPENIPIEELFKVRETALLFMAMAVIIAPLVEETLFRGYLYPLFARSFGVAPGIVITGLLFGMMHGAQLGWTWSLVSVLVVVGIIFTWVRARTGSVFASYLMHLGYNSLIALAAIVSTHGFTKAPGP